MIDLCVEIMITTLSRGATTRSLLKITLLP